MRSSLRLLSGNTPHRPEYDVINCSPTFRMERPYTDDLLSTAVRKQNEALLCTPTTIRPPEYVSKLLTPPITQDTLMLKQIKSVPSLPDLRIEYKDKLPNGDMGLCHAALDLIQLSLKENTTQKILDKTAFHEIIHLCLYKSGFSEILSEANVSEEALVIMLENSLFPLIQFNYKANKKSSK